MSEVAGARGTHYGVAMFDVTLKPQRGFSFRIAEQYGVNTFNTFFGQVEQLWPLAHDLQLQVGAQLMDQRAIGDALVARTQVSNPVTWARLPVEVEYDLRVDYQPPAIPGLRVRLCGVIYDQKGATRLGYQVRSIVDWEIPLL